MKINNGAIPIGVLLICFAIFVLSQASRDRFPAASRPAEAVISSTHVFTAPYHHSGRIWRGIGNGGEVVFQLSYVFNINGRDYTGTDTVLTPPASRNITVLYNPDNPSQNKIKRLELGRIAGWILLGLGILYIVLFSGVAARSQSKDREPTQ